LWSEDKRLEFIVWIADNALAGEALPSLRQGLKEAKAGLVGRVTTREQILVRQARKKSGLT